MSDFNAPSHGVLTGQACGALSAGVSDGVLVVKHGIPTILDVPDHAEGSSWTQDSMDLFQGLFIRKPMKRL